MAFRPLISYTTLMCSFSRKVVSVHRKKYAFIAQRPLVSAASSLGLSNRNQGKPLDTRHLLLRPLLLTRTSIADCHILQNSASKSLLQEINLVCSDLKSMSDAPLALRAFQLKTFSSNRCNDPQRHKEDNPFPDEELRKLTLVQRFKAMCQNYWHVLIPIHLVTSVGWIGAFYYTATSGVDIPAFLEALNLSETYIKPFRDSSMGYIAVAYGLYKIATPARYTVTVGGTSLAVKILRKHDMVHPWPIDFKRILLKMRRRNK